MKPTKGAMQLMFQGAEALAEVSANGIRIDVDYLDRTLAKVQAKIGRIETHLEQSHVWAEWRAAYRADASLDSRTQLADVLFNRLGHPCTIRTKKGRQSTSEKSLEAVDLPFVRDYFQRAKLKKLDATYLQGIRREVCGEFLHPDFPLHFTRSYRGSSASPNFQNIPIRDPLIAKLIRRAFVPREGHVLVEVDYVSAEVKAACCFHKDPTMLKYIETGYDLHTDMASQVFGIPKDDVTKGARYLGKNGFVFPSFYGSGHADIAQNMWDAASKIDGLRDHLCQQGINELGACNYQQTPRAGSFEERVKNVFDDFWQRRFSVYGKWRQDWWEAYKRNGGFKSLTGFVYEGIYKFTEATNLPIQGSAFHWLLWSLIQSHKRLKKMKSRIVGQIHDSMLIDCHESELSDVVGMVREVMTELVRNHWRWICVPLEVEFEAAEQNWFEKKELVT